MFNLPFLRCPLLTYIKMCCSFICLHWLIDKFLPPLTLNNIFDTLSPPGPPVQGAGVGLEPLTAG
jgi:hypothetical protein